MATALKTTPLKKVVLLHPSRQPMGDARRRAEAMAAVLGARVMVVKLALAGDHQHHPLFPQPQATGGALQQALREVQIIERWQALRQRNGARRMEVTCSAPSVEDLLVVCGQPGVVLVVMPASFGWFASRVTGLASRAGVPVLLAQRARARERLLAATSLEDPTLPVVHQAVGFADRLEASLSVVHNASGPGPRQDPAADASLEHELQEEVASMGRSAQVTVTHQRDPAQGILEAAGRENTDLIVVGVQAGGDPAVLTHRVPERVCAAADCSVLLVPV